MSLGIQVMMGCLEWLVIQVLKVILDLLALREILAFLDCQDPKAHGVSLGNLGSLDHLGSQESQEMKDQWGHQEPQDAMGRRGTVDTQGYLGCRDLLDYQVFMDCQDLRETLTTSHPLLRLMDILDHKGEMV